MRAIIITEREIIIDGQLHSATELITSVIVPELPAYKAEALVKLGTSITMDADGYFIVVPTRIIKTRQFFDE